MTAMIHRLPDWRPRLIAYLHEVAHKPFVEGQHDCALFAAGAVQAMTGTDLAAEWRGYSSTREGIKALISSGYKSHVDIVASMFDEVAPALAQPGDIAAVQLDDDIPALGVVQGERIYVVGPDRLLSIPRRSAIRAFEVPQCLK